MFVRTQEEAIDERENDSNDLIHRRKNLESISILRFLKTISEAFGAKKVVKLAPQKSY